MKKLQQFFAAAMILCLSLTALIIPSAAADREAEGQVTVFDDGSYTITVIEYDQPQAGNAVLSTQNSTGGVKTSSHYNSSDELMWVFRLYGSFTYNGTTAKATAANCSYTIYDNSWSFIEASTSCSGATATGTGSFRLLFFPYTVTLDLTCSPTGALS